MAKEKSWKEQAEELSKQVEKSSAETKKLMAEIDAYLKSKSLKRGPPRKKKSSKF